MVESSTSGNGRWLVVANGGTSNLRVHLLDRNERVVVATVRRSVGVADVARGTARDALWEAFRQGVQELESIAQVPLTQIVAVGMLTAEVGLAQVPHAQAPAGPNELSQAAQRIEAPALDGRTVLLIPGVMVATGVESADWTEFDMMRGEECETLGAWSMLSRPEPPPVFVWPGSHTKVVALDAQGRISGSYTTLAGELLQAMARHTLIRASLPPELPEHVDLTVLRQVEPIIAQHGLARAGFLVRLSQVLGQEDDPMKRGAFWTAAVVADDALHLARQAILSAGSAPIWVGGREPLRTLYAEALRTRLPGRAIHTLSDEQVDSAAALGALEVLARSHDAEESLTRRRGEIPRKIEKD